MESESLPSEPPPDINQLILSIREQRVILDADLALIYGVPTKRLNEQVRRNRDRFPEDFAFQLKAKEWHYLRSQFATKSVEPAQSESVGLNWSQFATRSSLRRRASYIPYAFTEHGALMAANVLNSPQAIQMSVFVVRAFLKMRAALTDTRALARKLENLEQELKSRLDIHEAAIVDVLQRVMRILDPPPAPPEPPRPPIGFHAKPTETNESKARRK